jgi:hypothetical protein
MTQRHNIRPIRLLALAVLLCLMTAAAAAAQTLPKMYWGASIGTQFTGQQPPFDWNAQAAFSKLDAGGKPASIANWGQPFYASAYCNSTPPYPTGHYCGFQTSLFESARERGYIPMLSWSSQSVGDYFSPQFLDGAVAKGSQDAYIRQWAKDAKAWGHPLFLRFDWEMNGVWFNYGTGIHGSSGTTVNKPSQFVAMWRHVHSIFTQVGAKNVTWLWCPNIEYSGGSSPASNFPGNAYIDWMCIDGYNGNDPWLSFQHVFAKTYKHVVALSPKKPMLIGETATTGVGGSKARWISGMFSSFATAFPKVRGFVWEDVVANGPGGRTDWPIEGLHPNNPNKGAIAAFTAGINASRYRTNHYSQLNTSPIPRP